MADLEDRIAALEANAASVKTDLDALIGRLDALENAAPVTGDASAEILDIKTKANDFYNRVFGDVLFQLPPPDTPAA